MISLSCNDHILHTVSKQKEALGNTKGAHPPVSLNDLNEYISLTISGMLLPRHSVQKSHDKLLIG